MKQERILIAEDYNNQLSPNFYFAIRQLRKTLTNEKLGEVGLTLDSNVLRDILSGGISRKVTKGLSDNGNKG